MTVEMLTGSKLPSGFTRAWPEVIGCWRHESGVWLCLQRFGRAVSLCWRIRPTYAVWPHDVMYLDESQELAINTANAISQAEALLALGPSPDVQSARETARIKYRERSRRKYREMKAAAGPTKRDLMREGREAIARIVGGAAGAALLESFVANGEKPAEPVRNKGGRPRIEDVAKAAQLNEARAQRVRDLLAQAALETGVGVDDVENYRTRGVSGKGSRYVMTAWLGTDPGKLALAEVTKRVDVEFGTAT